MALGVDLELSAEYFRSGTHFLLTATVYNIGGPDVTVEQYIILDVFGQYWFWPMWRESVGNIIRTLETGDYYEHEIILDFIWPDVDGSIEGIRFWAALLDPGLLQILGDYDMVTFGYGP